MRKKITIFLITFLCLIFFSFPAVASDKPPLTLEGDKLSYDSETGLFTAQGNVIAVQGDLSLKADSLTGNTQSKDIYASGNVFWQQGKDSWQAQEMNYNYETKDGSFRQAQGCLNNYFVTTVSGNKNSTQSVLLEGSLTGCNAHKVKCYEIRAKKMIIYPGKKLVAQHASFYILGKKLFTLSQYTASLEKKQTEQSHFPKISYSNDTGLSVGYKYYLSLDENAPADVKSGSFLAANYYHQYGLQLQYQLDKDWDNSHFNLILGKQLDKDNKELQALPQLNWQQKRQALGKTGVSYAFSVDTGYFKGAKKDYLDQETSAYRNKLGVSLMNKPIFLSKSSSLTLWTSYEKSFYSTDEQLDNFSYGAIMDKKISEQGNYQLAYTNRKMTGTTPFNFDDPGAAEELNANISYQLDHLWRIGVSADYDLEKKYYKDVDYTLIRNMHCFETKITWRSKRDELRWSVDLAKF